MKSEVLHERRASASRMEAVMLVVTVICVLAAAFAFLHSGWMPSLGFLALGSLAFGLSRVFDLLGELFASQRTVERKITDPSAVGTAEQQQRPNTVQGMRLRRIADLSVRPFARPTRPPDPEPIARNHPSW